jgi:hypothetical protein
MIQLEKSTENTLVGFKVLMKLYRLIKMCLSEIYSKVHMAKYFSDNSLSKIV